MKIAMITVAIASAVWPAATMSQTTGLTRIYLCDRNVVVHAAYINATDVSYAVVYADTQQLLLVQTEAASGVKYAGAGSGSHVWWVKGREATLLWYEDGAETPLLACQEYP